MINFKIILCITFIFFMLVGQFSTQAVIILTDNFIDQNAIDEAYALNMDSVVLVITENKRGARVGTGVVVNLPGRKDLNGRLILTAAHVIENGVWFVVPNAKGDMNNVQPNKIEAIAHPKFIYDKAHETRNFDFGIILLENPLTVSAKELPTNHLLKNNENITMVGYGAYLNLKQVCN